VSFDNDVSQDAANILRHDMIHNWKYGPIYPHKYFGFLYFCNPFLLCFVQARFQVQSTSRTTFLQKGENDEDMTHAYDHGWCMEWSRRSPTRVSKWNRRHEANPVRVPEVEA
jgi:hypothetical protein